MYRISELQLAVLRVLWDRGRSTVTETHAALAEERSLAPTTVATLLKRLEKRGLVAHETEGRRHVYHALVSEHEIRTSLLDSVTDTVFGGDVTALVSHLLGARGVESGELEQVRALLERMQAENAENEESDDV